MRYSLRFRESQILSVHGHVRPKLRHITRCSQEGIVTIDQMNVVVTPHSNCVVDLNKLVEMSNLNCCGGMADDILPHDMQIVIH